MISSLRTGQALKHYAVLHKIGLGGMGQVYKAEDKKLWRFVAVKLLPEAAAASDTARRRLLQEARSASLLNHPCIVTIHSIEEHEGVDFIVMEYVAVAHRLLAETAAARGDRAKAVEELEAALRDLTSAPVREVLAGAGLAGVTGCGELLLSSRVA